MRFWTEWGGFIRESRRHFHDTGAVLPSSRFLGRALASELAKPHQPARVLEVGPGTGSVTAQILRALQPSDQLDVVELNSQFFALLQGRFEREEPFRRHHDQVKLIHGPVQSVPGEAVYDYIISGLPLNNFSVALVREIYRVFNRLIKPGGMLSYFEYLAVRHLKTPFVSRRERLRLAGVGHVVGRYIRAHQVRYQRVLINVPPAVARHLCLKPMPTDGANPSGAISTTSK
jgi:phospholipid N-methyltransferase